MVADLQEEVSRRQAARLARKAAPVDQPRGRTSPWAHVKLADLFRETGNVVHAVPGGEGLECGHQPFHGSRSGRCVRIDPKRGLWFCRSCRAGGDAVAFWMARTGLSRTIAARQLAERFGPPAARRRRATIAIHWTEV